MTATPTADATLNSTGRASLSDDDVQAVDRLREAYAKLREELARVIVGQGLSLIHI